MFCVRKSNVTLRRFLRTQNIYSIGKTNNIIYFILFIFFWGGGGWGVGGGMHFMSTSLQFELQIMRNINSNTTVYSNHSKKSMTSLIKILVLKPTFRIIKCIIMMNAKVAYQAERFSMRNTRHTRSMRNM